MSFLDASIRFMRKLLKTSTAIAAFGANTFEEIPGLKPDSSETDDEVAVIQRAQVSPADSHTIGTCSRLPEHLSRIVNQQFQVYRIKGLRIVDANVIPLIPGAHLMSTMYAVAEKAENVNRIRYVMNASPPWWP